MSDASRETSAARWSKPTHYVLRGDAWFKCPRQCGGMCEWRPGDAGPVVVPFRRGRSKS